MNSNDLFDELDLEQPDFSDIPVQETAAAETYEQKEERLYAIVQRLQEEQIPLEEAVKLYAEGMAFAAECSAILEQTQLQVQNIPVPGRQDQNNG